MGQVLLRLEGGGGVMRREDGSVAVTADLERGSGSPVHERDPYAPVRCLVDDDRSIVGGLLPSEAVTAEVVDERGARAQATTANGVYAAVIARSYEPSESIVCCRDGSGHPVRRPLPGSYPVSPVTDTDLPCPACGALDYEEYVPTEDWRGGRTVKGVTTPSPVVSCRACGFEIREGVIMRSRPADPREDPDVRERRRERTRAQQRWRLWQTRRMALDEATFPIYTAQGWPTRLGSQSSLGDQLYELTVHHFHSADADPLAGDRPVLAIDTTAGAQAPLRDDLRAVREALGHWVRDADRSRRGPNASDAALTLWFQARERAARAHVLDAVRIDAMISIDGAPTPALVLRAPTGAAAAVLHHAGLRILITAHDVDLTELRLEPVTDPVAQLLGPEPEDPGPS